MDQQLAAEVLGALGRSEGAAFRTRMGFCLPDLLHVCYTERFCGTLADLRERLGYLAELGITYLHLMPFAASATRGERRWPHGAGLPRRRSPAGDDG